MKHFLVNFFAVGSAGFIASVLRWLISLVLNTQLVPWGTLFINILGSFALGYFMGLIANRTDISDTFRFAVAVGFIGTFTTFSSLMFEIDARASTGALWIAIAYLTASIVLGLLAVRLGLILATPVKT